MAELSRSQILKDPEVLGTSTSGAKIRLQDGDESAYIDLKAPDVVTTSYTLTLPSDDGLSGQVLQTNGSGTTTWASFSAAAAGAEGYLQYYSGGALAGAAGLTTDGVHLTLKAAGEIRFADTDSSNYLSFKAPGTVAANRAYTLPATIGSVGQVLKIATGATATAATLEWANDETGGAGSSPGGLDTYVQFNDGGTTFGGDAGLTYNKTTDVLSVGGAINLGSGGNYNINGITRISSTNVGLSTNLFTNVYSTNLIFRDPSDDVSITHTVDTINETYSLTISAEPISTVFYTGIINLVADLGAESSGTSSINLTSNETNVNSILKVRNNQSLNLYDAGNTNFVGFRPPSSVSSSYQYQFPSGVGAVDDILAITSVAGSPSVATLAFINNYRTINFIIDGGGSVITTGVKGFVVVDFDCQILNWTIQSSIAGAIVIDIWKKAYAANTVPAVGNSIIGVGGTKPTLTATNLSSQSASLNNYTTSISAGDVLAFNVDSATAVTLVTLALKVKMT